MYINKVCYTWKCVFRSDFWTSRHPLKCLKKNINDKRNVKLQTLTLCAWSLPQENCLKSDDQVGLCRV